MPFFPMSLKLTDLAFSCAFCDAAYLHLLPSFLHACWVPIDPSMCLSVFLLCYVTLFSVHALPRDFWQRLPMPYSCVKKAMQHGCVTLPLSGGRERREEEGRRKKRKEEERMKTSAWQHTEEGRKVAMPSIILHSIVNT